MSEFLQITLSNRSQVCLGEAFLMSLIASPKKILEFLSKLSIRSRQKLPELMLSDPSLAIVVDRLKQWVENNVFFAKSLSVRVRVQVRSDVIGKRFVIE